MYALQFPIFMNKWFSSIFRNRKKANRRKDERHPVLLEVRLNSESVSNARARMTNLGLKGGYIEMLIAVERGEKMQINISLPTEKALTVDGIVTFCDPQMGFGVEFDLTDSQKEFMQDLIEFARQDV